MKIALKHQNTVKIYNGLLNFEAISSFAVEEFKIIGQNLFLSYFDEEGDEITICTNEDFGVLVELYKEKPIVKVNIKISDSAKDLIQITDTSAEKARNQKQAEILLEEEKVQTKTQETPQQQTSENEKVENKKECSEEKKWKHGKHGHYGHHGHHGHHWHHKNQGEQPQYGHHRHSESSSSFEGKHHFNRFQKMHHFMNARIVHEVDERIKVLLPCLKNQLSSENPIKLFSVPNSLVHPSTQCKGCYATPITGIRYKCLTCPEFSLCEACQATVEHPHNLLKMKFIENDQSKNSQIPFPFKRWGWGKHYSRAHSSSSSKSKDPQFWALKKGKKLAKFFGGKPQDYKEFVQANKDLKIGQTLSKFAKENNRDFSNAEQFCFKGRKCEKLSKMFGLQASHFEKFVQQNIGLKPKELVEKYAKENNISADQLAQKKIALKCQKLGKMFDKEPETFKSIVTENLELKCHQLKRLVMEKFGQGFMHPWAFKHCRFGNGEGNRWWNNKKCSKEKSSSPFLKKQEEKVSEEKKEKKCEKSNEKREIYQEKKSKSNSFKKENIQKSNILKVMVEYFGTKNVDEYYKLIEEHFSQGQQKIIQIYIDNHSK